MTSTEILLTALAGLGLFFFGIKMVTRYLGAMAGDGLRRRLSRATSTRAGAALMGVLAGLITQSGRTTSFVLGSFAQAGVVLPERTLPVIVWSNLGCALIVFVAVLPIHLVALMMLGLAGACIAFERPRPLLGAAHAVFGLAVMLLGLKMMSSTAPVLSQLEHVSLVLNALDRSPFYAFVIGMGLTIATQSHMAIILLNVPLAAHGVLGFEQSTLLVYGAQAGSSVVTYMTGTHFRGGPRQAVTAQILYNVVGIAIFVPLFLVDEFVLPHGGVMGWLSRTVHGTADSHVALVVVAFNVVTPLVITAFLPLYARLCAAVAPPRTEEELGRPTFLWDEMRDNTATALLLAEREQLRLLRRLPEYFAYLRQPDRPRQGLSPATHHDAFTSVSGCIRRYQSRLMGQSMSPADTEWLLNQQQRQDVLSASEDACHEFCAVALANDRADLRSILSTLAEAIDILALTAVSAMAECDTAELDLLDRLTANNGAAMESVRKRYLASSDALPSEARTRIVRMTSLFERAAWSLGRFGQLLRGSPALTAAAPDMTGGYSSPGNGVKLRTNDRFFV